MDHAISIDGRDTRATPNDRLEALKGRNLPTSDNQKPLEDGDVNKIMDCDLYEATINGDVEKFINALKQVSESRKLALSLIFDQVTPSGNSLLHVAASSGSEHVMELILFHYPYLVTRKKLLRGYSAPCRRSRWKVRGDKKTDSPKKRLGNCILEEQGW
ncbi:hypothetical protein ACJRO7_006761 [Eucalyptus globulus]|uniref:Uncharacterized protein n=1 Tax=Eucalyptus globulus TaxID=34317 RepID=A0ABD3IIY2_EUCGL